MMASSRPLSPAAAVLPCCLPPFERHHLEADRAVASFHTGLAARRSRMLADTTARPGIMCPRMR